MEQIYNLFKNHTIVTTEIGDKVVFSVRTQLITFYLPALAQNCDIIQFNGYDACPDCKIHGIVMERQVFYPYFNLPAARKTDNDYMIFSTLRSFIETI